MAQAVSQARSTPHVAVSVFNKHPSAQAHAHSKEAPAELNDSSLLLALATSSLTSPRPSFLSDDSLLYSGAAPSLHSEADGSEDYTSASPITTPSRHDSSVGPTAPERAVVRVPAAPPPEPAPRARDDGSPALSAGSGGGSGRPQTAPLPARPTGKKRTRMGGGLTGNERLEWRREQHRVTDSTRRQRESEAEAHLRALIRRYSQQRGQANDGIEARSGVEVEEESESRQSGASRLFVLQSSIALIEQLAAACERKDEACEAKVAQVNHSATEAHNMASNMAQPFWQPVLPHSAVRPFAPPQPCPSLPTALPTSVSSDALYAGMSPTMQQSTVALLSTMCVLVVTLPALVVLDANTRFLAMSGYARADITHLLLSQSPLCRGVNQNLASTAAVSAIAAGSRWQGSGVWRCRKADGLLCELLVSFFALFSGEQADDGVDERRLPDRMLIVGSPREVVLVGEAETADVR